MSTASGMRPGRGLLSRRRVLLLLGAAGPVWFSPARAAEMVIQDCRGRSVTLKTAQRLVSIGGAITETLYDLGAADRIAAVDTTSTWPAAALQTKKSVGYMRALSAEGILSLQPDAILCMNDAGPPAVIDQLMASPVPVVMVDATPSAEAVIGRTRFLAHAVGSEAEGEAICRTIADGFETLRRKRAALQKDAPRTKVIFIMAMRNGRPMIAGTGTAADSIITLSGFENAGAGVHGYKVFNDEALISIAPDAVLTMSESGPHLQQELLSHAALGTTPAGRAKRFVSMEGELMLSFGPRTPQAALELADKITASLKAG